MNHINMKPGQFIDLPNDFYTVQKPVPPKPVIAIEGFKPWDRNKEPLRDYAFNCGMKTGIVVGLFIGWIAGGIFAAWFMR